MENDRILSNHITGDRISGLCDVFVIGGGLAGLCMAIQCARAGYSVILAEKEQYPFHKVCGEYISLESWDFLEEMGVPLSEMNLPVIRKLMVTAPNGKALKHMLPQGGFGISRYELDKLLASIATQEGAIVLENIKVDQVQFENETFTVKASAKTFRAKIVVAAYGKRSNLDMKWRRSFALQKKSRLDNFIGVKYHVRCDLDPDVIALHNFMNGYCGISRIEDGKYCLCYLTTAQNLKNSNNSIPEMEKNILYRNPHIKNIFNNAEFLFTSPVTISQICFERKTQVEDHVLLTGDAAGMITPLCGNGMSMALHGSKLLFTEVNKYLCGDSERKEMEEQYTTAWRNHFGRRLQTGRVIQSFFGNAALSNLLITTLKPFPSMINRLISATHGQPF